MDHSPNATGPQAPRPAAGQDHEPNGEKPKAPSASLGEQKPTGTHDGQQPNQPANGKNRILQVSQAANLQRLAYDAATALGKALNEDGELKVSREDAMAIAQLVRAWDTAADRLRVLRGKGLPAAVKSRQHKSRQSEPEIVSAPFVALPAAGSQAEPTKAAAN